MKGSMEMTHDLRIALKAAVEEAIKAVGIDQFKKSSLFLSNGRDQADVKVAA